MGAEKELLKAFQGMHHNKTKSFLQNNGSDRIVWHRNPPAASNMGYIWEQQISFARQIFAALIKTHGRCLDNETLRTLMVEVPQMTGYHNVYIQKNYCMNLKTSDKKLLEIYNLIWNKVKQLEIKFRNKTS